MKLEQSFEVQAPIDVVWRALNDLERVAPCLPGATITGHDEDGTYHGEFKVKLGPTTAAYRGTIKISEADEAAHKATLVAKGTDKRGQGGANATIVNTLTEADGATRVEAVTDFSITGRLARFGRGGMIEDISKRLLRDFGTCLATRLGEQPSGAEVTAGAAAPEALDTPPAAAPETTGAEVTAGDAAPEAVAAAEPAPAESQSSGADVASGEAAPETLATPARAGAPVTEPGEVAPGAAEDATAGAAPPPPAPQASPAGAGTPGPGPAASTPPPSVAPPSSAAASPPPSAEPLNAGGLFFSVLWERIKRMFRRGS